MKLNVFALLIAAVLLSLPNVARAETMAQRKQRIMRRYMRERQDIMQSDFGVPEAVQEDSRIAESEQFKELSPDFQRQKGGVAPPPMARSLPVQQEERNWWLETPEEEENLFADPFSAKTDAKEESTSAWSPWGKRDDSSAYGNAYGQQRDGQDDTYSGRREQSTVYGDAYGQQRGDTYPGAWSAYGVPGESGNRSYGSGMTYDGYTTRRVPTSRERDQMPGYYGRQQLETRGTGPGWTLDSGGRYNSSPALGLPQSSLPSPTDTRGWSSQNQTPGYTPYRSPYQTQGNEQDRYGGNMQSQPSPYTRPNNYQKWKDSNKAWEPASGNVYLDELMRNERR